MRGVVYTPEVVVRSMVEASLGRWLWRGPVPPAAVRRDAAALRGRAWRDAREVAALRVLDPACGEGAFLLEAFDCLREWHLARAQARGGALGTETVAAAARAAAASLHGIDLDGAALVRAAEALRVRGAPPGGGVGPAAAGGVWLHRGDALLGPPAAAPVGGRFDFVLGNPPFVFGEQLSPDEKRAYRVFELGRAGQADLFRLFCERALRDFVRPGGTLAFLLPDAVLARDEHSDLRAWLVRHGAVVRLCHLGRVFPRTGVSVVAIVVEKVPGSGRPCAVDRWTGDRALPGPSLSPEALAAPPGRPWSLVVAPGWDGPRGLRRLLEAGGRLGAVLGAGPRGLTRGEELGKAALTECPRPGSAAPGHVAVYTGVDVARLAAGPPRRQVPGSAVRKDPAVYRGPKVLVVKTGGAPVAAAVADSFPTLQSVYLLHPAPALDPDGVAAVLCSALVAAYAYYVWTSGKRLQPQLTLGNVRALPFPAAAGSDALAGLGGAVRALGLAAGAGRPGATGDDVAARERRLDAAVARLFGLVLDDWLPTLRPALDALPPSQRPRWWPPR